MSESTTELKGTATDVSPKLLAAQYVRMSTDHQRYSIENQIDALREYAGAHDMDIVRTYADAGRSGLNIEGREALQRLIADVEGGKADFDVLLVYDISRWGRFQDIDESAHYEFVCRKAGIEMIYVAEPFANDGSPLAAIVKGLKRAMAAEYSRELGRKVSIGQTRMAERGFWQGGRAPYGYRRCVVTEDGVRRQVLADGEWKALATDRVILVPGPPNEVANVRRMFDLFIHEDLCFNHIAKTFNAEGLLTRDDNPWSDKSVSRIIRNPVYQGDNCYNRKRESKLERGPAVYYSPERWLRVPNAFEAIVPRGVFEAAGLTCERRKPRIATNEDLLKRLAKLLKREGHLSAALIREKRYRPSEGLLKARFGSLRRAYQLIGYTPGDIVQRRYTGQERVARLRLEIAKSVANQIAQAGWPVDLIDAVDVVCNGLCVRTLVLSPMIEAAGRMRWKTDARRADHGVTLLVCTDRDRAPMQYHLVPAHFFPGLSVLLGKREMARIEGYRHESLDGIVSAISHLLTEGAGMNDRLDLSFTIFRPRY